MKYLDYPEQQKHGSLDFPYYFYRVTPIHPRYTMPYHWHPLFEIVHVFQGQFHLQLDNCLLELNAGDTALIQGGLTHGGAPSPNEDCIYECILIDLETVFSHSTRQYEQALTDLLNSKILVRNFFPASFTDINQLIDQMLDLLRSKPKSYALSSYFCRYFKEFTDRTPMDYLNYYRIEVACEQLSYTDKTITEIAHSCGFYDSSYFIKVFRHYKHMTPTEYTTNRIPRSDG